MICDNLDTTLVDYGGIGPKIARAIEWLKNCDPAVLQPDQMVRIDGNRISGKLQVYRTMEPAEAYFEAHRLFVDVQMIISGKETIYWTSLERLPGVAIPYDYDADVVFFREPRTSTALPLEAKDFVVFFPSDGHKPKCITEQSEEVQKIVVKVAV